MTSIRLIELYQYHQLDRALFTRMVNLFMRDPAESLLAMAFWLWLEDKHYPCLVKKLLETSDFMINKMVNESIICLNSLAEGEPIPPPSSTLAIMSVLEQNLPLAMMHQDKASTILGIKYFLNNVCAFVFTDMLIRAISGANAPRKQLYDSVNVPGFPHPIFGDITILNLPLYELFHVGDLWVSNMRTFYQ